MAGDARDSPEGIPSAGSGDRTHFGFQTVDTTEKQRMVGDVFRRVAERYVNTNRMQQQQ